MGILTRTTPEQAPVSRVACLVIALVLASATGPAFADRGVPWNSLDNSEQQQLHKYRNNWRSLSPNDQEKLRSGARRYLRLSPDKKRAVERERREYQEMSTKERKRLKKKYEEQRRHR